MPAAAPAQDEVVQTERPLRALEASVAGVARGKDEAIRLCLAALVARGHILVEDIPGVGKTTLARALAAALGGTFRRIQFTSDLLPSDILGVTVYRRDTGTFEFQRGPIFANVVLADEINRTAPRTQSALLEAMSEGRISVDDGSYALDQPFVVIATQNPVEHFGTYPLPESQLDRFLLRVRLGYPERQDERALLRSQYPTDPVADLGPAIAPGAIAELQRRADRVTVSDDLLDYTMNVVEATRSAPALAIGVSTRGALGWSQLAKAYALLAGRDYCIPDDFKDLAIPALAHRVVLAGLHESPGRARQEAESTIGDILERVHPPAP